MKKLLHKLTPRRAAKTPISTRITNETVAEHRERILAGGRRFKYPMQYARHRLVITTILVSIVALALITVIGWWQLYPVQNTSTFFYRVTRALPLPVANVDGETVPYSEYLMYYNSSAHYLQQTEQVNFQSADGKGGVMNDVIKRKSLDIVIANAYARKLARELHVTVDDKRVDKVTQDARSTSTGLISQETYDASALSILGWTPSEYRQDARSKLLLQDVSFAIDSAAKKKETTAIELLKQTPAIDFKTLATQLGGEGDAKPTTGTSGLVPLTNQDGGLAAAAAKLQVGQVSSVIRTTAGDGYYFVKVIAHSDTQVNYEFLRIPLTQFNTQLAALKKAGKVHEYISIKSVDTQK
jgi:hypothetical protein